MTRTSKTLCLTLIITGLCIAGWMMGGCYQAHGITLIPVDNTNQLRLTAASRELALPIARTTSPARPEVQIKRRHITLPPLPPDLPVKPSTKAAVVPPHKGSTNNVAFRYAAGLDTRQMIWGIRARAWGTKDWTVIWLAGDVDAMNFASVTNTGDAREIETFGSPR